VARAIEAAGWGWRHSDRRGFALRHLDLTVEEGERILLLGASGAGKSTLLKALAGVLRAPEAGDEEGALLVGGRPAGDLPGYAGLLFQDPSSAIVMGRLGDDVAFGMENRAVPPERIWPRVLEVLELVGLDYPLDRRTDRLSGGEQQRLAIAGLLALSPRLWLLDEPTANLDPEGAAMVRETIAKVVDRTRAAVLLVEHRVTGLAELVDRVVVLEPAGGVLADGPPGEIFSRLGARLRAEGVWVPGPPPARLAPPRAPGLPVVAAEGLSVVYPGSTSPALDGIDLTAYEGQVLAVTGSNGSGKTTLALALASLLAPTGGEVRFLGGTLHAAPSLPAPRCAGAVQPGGRPPRPATPYPKWPARELVRHVGTVFQQPEHQFVTASVAAELAVGPRRCGMPEPEVARRTAELLERLALTHLADANPFTLSGGEQRRLSVATALATDPELLVLDEPTFGQDARGWDELAALLAAQRDGGRAVVTVTHDRELVAALADREAKLEGGRIVAACEPGPPTEVAPVP
jgi:energy-coupling factor transporter ATP-binding protein EcfA2